MKLSYVLAGITAAIWGLLALIGYRLLEDLRGQHVPGYPSSGQANFYFHFPVGMLLIVLIALAASHSRPLKVPAIIIYALSMVAVPPYLFGYTGGV
jgi:hypothetical protein